MCALSISYCTAIPKFVVFTSLLPTDKPSTPRAFDCQTAEAVSRQLEGEESWKAVLLHVSPFHSG